MRGCRYAIGGTPCPCPCPCTCGKSAGRGDEVGRGGGAEGALPRPESFQGSPVAEQVAERVAARGSAETGIADEREAGEGGVGSERRGEGAHSIRADSDLPEAEVLQASVGDETIREPADPGVAEGVARETELF